MFEQVKGINIKGGYFDDEITFSFLEKSKPTKPKFISAVYGKNGSGKSSVARAFDEISKGLNIYNKVDLIDHEDNIINVIDDNYKNRIFVFDEEYILKKTKYEDDGLSTIIMLGEQVELDNEIKSIKQQQEKTNSKIERIAEKYNSDYLESESITSPLYYEKILIDNFKKNWAEAEREILERRRNPDVNIRIIKSKFNEVDTIEESIDSLKNAYENKKKSVEIIKNNTPIVFAIKKIKVDYNIEAKITELLEKKIDKPNLSERENKIIEIIKKYGKEHIVNVEKHFNNSDYTYCPYCFQKINNEYISVLMESINTTLNIDQANKHIEELSRLTFEEISIEYEKYEKANSELVSRLKDEINQYTRIIKNIDMVIEEKKDNVYTPIMNKEINLTKTQQKINKAIDDIEEACKVYNEKFKKMDEIKRELSLLNKKLAIKENKINYDSMLKQQDKQQIESEKIEALKKNSIVLDNKLTELESRKKNIIIAKDIINHYLEYIFFDKNRISIDIENSNYIVKSRGNYVELKSLSQGERNVIALCYFFAETFHNKSEEDVFSEECLVIIDDPISSFDFDNKIGVFSFLRLMIEKIHKANANNRIIIFTHEMETLYNLEKLISDIKINRNVSILTDKKLNPFLEKKHNQYSKLIQQIYYYAAECDGFQSCSNSIGNIMRKTLEAYATFNYKQGIESFSTDDEILGIIESEKLRLHFKNLMYRLVLNGESHLQFVTQSYPDRDFFEFISESEKVRTAKEILVLIHELNPLHIRAHINDKEKGDIEEKICNIIEWKKEMCI